MARHRGIRRFGKGLVQGFKATASLLGRTARGAKTILGHVDKLTGGQGTAALASHPYGKTALMASEFV